MPPSWVVDEARRIPGLHPLLDGPGVGCELRHIHLHDAREAAARVQALWARLDLGHTPVVLRPHAQGVSLAIRAPVDCLYAATQALEAALGDDPPDEDALRAALAAEARPALRALLADPALPLFADDDALTAGMGIHARSWPLDALPTPDAAHAAAVGIPFALITGTNGKTTTTRLVAAMAHAAGHVAGHTSSDGVVVDGEWVEEGDWTGPGAARTLLRDPRVTLAVLETARGGLLRRGLALGGAHVAAVTNISDDHLGEWGLDDLPAMAWAKLSIVRGVRLGGTLVLHGRDPVLQAALAEGPRADLRVRRFADAPPAPDLDAWVEDGALWVRTPPPEAAACRLLAEVEVPVTHRGQARFMVENALCAALVALSLGLSLEAIRAGLAAFRPDPVASRGRLNGFRLPGGARAVVDFAHNPAGVRGLAGIVAAHRPGRLAVLCGQAGDRTDALIDAYADAIAALGPDLVVLKELPHYRRGRAEGEVRARLQARLQAAGIPAHAMAEQPEEVAAAADALDWAGAGDLVLLLVHEEVQAVLDLLAARGAVADG